MDRLTEVSVVRLEETGQSGWDELEILIPERCEFSSKKRGISDIYPVIDMNGVGRIEIPAPAIAQFGADRVQEQSHI